MSSPRRRAVNPATRDWTLVKGERVGDASYVSSVIFLITLQYNSSPVLPGLGSKFHLINKITPDLSARCKKEVERCLLPLTGNRKISDVETTVTVVEQSVSIAVTWRDRQGDRKEQKFTFTVVQ